MDKFQYNFIQIEIPDFDPEFFSLWLSDVVGGYNKVVGEVCFIFCTDEYLIDLNRRHLQHDYFTDIITFNYNTANTISGDLFISYERVIENSKQFSDNSAYDELCRVMVHGLLHLVGFDDKTEQEKKLMREEETKCLIKR